VSIERPTKGSKVTRIQAHRKLIKLAEADEFCVRVAAVTKLTVELDIRFAHSRASSNLHLKSIEHICMR
jgi:hypothetical protein